MPPALLPSTGALPILCVKGGAVFGVSSSGHPSPRGQNRLGGEYPGTPRTRTDQQEHPSPCRRAAAESCRFGEGIEAAAPSWNPAGVRAWHLCPQVPPHAPWEWWAQNPWAAWPIPSVLTPAAHPHVPPGLPLCLPRTAPLSCIVPQALWGAGLPG